MNDKEKLLASIKDKIDSLEHNDINFYSIILSIHSIILKHFCNRIAIKSVFKKDKYDVLDRDPRSHLDTEIEIINNAVGRKYSLIYLNYLKKLDNVSVSITHIKPSEEAINYASCIRNFRIIKSKTFNKAKSKTG